MTHIWVSKLTIIGSDNGLAPGRRQTIIWTNDGILLTGPLGTNFSEILIGIQTFSFKKMHLKMSSAKWRPFCLGLNVLMIVKHKYFLHYWHRRGRTPYVHSICQGATSLRKLLLGLQDRYLALVPRVISDEMCVVGRRWRWGWGCWGAYQNIGCEIAAILSRGR